MCGIVGYIGKNNAVPVVIQGLQRLEYRGYDSCGIAMMDDNSLILEKVTGKVDELQGLLARQKNRSSVAIGHTRWATHGSKTDENSHPHHSNHGKFVLVHNGIIENYRTLKDLARRNMAGVPQEFLALESDLGSVMENLGTQELNVRTKLLEAYRVLAFPLCGGKDQFDLFSGQKTGLLLEC